MENCLLKTLKGTVNNDNLAVLGEIYVKNVSDVNKTFMFVTEGEGNTLRLQSGGIIPESGTTVIEMTPNVETNITVSAGDSVIVKDKYRLVTINATGGDLNLYEIYGDALLYLLSYKPECAVSDLHFGSELRSFVATLGTLMSGSLSQAASKFPKATVFRISQCKLTGNIQDLAPALNLKNIMVGDASQIGGSIEAFVAARRALGQTSSSETVKCAYFSTNNITFNGEKITVGKEADLTWTSTTITYDGVTITA